MLETFSFGTFLRVPLGCWSEFVVASYQSLWGDAGQQAKGDTSLLLWGNLYKCCCSLSKLLPLQSETGIRFHSRWRYTVDFCWVLSLSVSVGISKCNNSFHQVPLLLQYLFKMWQQWQRHEHYRWEAREKKITWETGFLCVTWAKKKEISAAERFACRHTNCGSWPTNTMTNVLHKDEQTVTYFNINSS